MKQWEKDLIPTLDKVRDTLDTLDPIRQMQVVELMVARLCLRAEREFSTDKKYYAADSEFVLGSVVKHVRQLIAEFKAGSGKITVNDLETTRQ